MQDIEDNESRLMVEDVDGAKLVVLTAILETDPAHVERFEPAPAGPLAGSI